MLYSMPAFIISIRLPIRRV